MLDKILEYFVYTLVSVTALTILFFGVVAHLVIIWNG